MRRGLITFGFITICLMLPIVSCAVMSTTNEKISPLLLSQIELREKQIANPIPERLEQMKARGMRVDNLSLQRIFIYLNQEPNQNQVAELQALGITLYLDSWIPPVGAHPAGFLLAEMPIDKVNDLAAKDYVVRLDTAEQLAQPQSVGETK
jgi:hypothetical protein